jgi:hypothetical protein
MSLPAAGGFMFSVEREADHRVVERRCVKPDDLKRFSMVLFVAFFTELRADRCMIALFFLHPRIDFRMATQALVIGKRFSDRMAGGTVLDAFPAGVPCDQLAGGNLGGGEGQRYTDAHEKKEESPIHSTLPGAAPQSFGKQTRQR